MTIVDKYALKEQLQNGVVTVVFEKKDGTERMMRATLSNELIPQVLSEYDENVPAPEKKESINVQPVWDVDANGWRSFRIDSVKQILSE